MKNLFHVLAVMHLSMLSRWWERPGIGGGIDSSHRPVVGTFDRFNGLSSNILLTFSCKFDNPQIPWGKAFKQKLSAQFKSPAYADPPPPPHPPEQLNIDRCIRRKLAIQQYYIWHKTTSSLGKFVLQFN